MHPSSSPPGADYLLTVEDVGRLLKLSRRSVWRWLRAGRIPTPVRYNKVCVRWRASDIQHYLAQRNSAAAR